MICLIVNTICTLLFIASAIAWASNEGSTPAAVSTVCTGAILVVTIPGHFCLWLRSRILVKPVEAA